MRLTWLIILLAGLAATGNIPYGFRFAQTLIAYPSLSIALGILFATAAVLTNMALGAYSLFKALQSDALRLGAFLISFLAAVPMGFLCFFGYQHFIPSYLSISLSLIVVLVNTGINYTAVFDLFETFKSYYQAHKAPSYYGMMGFVIGVLVSLTGLVAAKAGLNWLFHYLKNPLRTDFVYFFSILTWVPLSALYGNACYRVALYLHESLQHRVTSGQAILFQLLALLSGSAYAQMTFDFFTHHQAFIWMQSLAHYWCAMAYLASFAVNYYALVNLNRIWKISY